MQVQRGMDRAIFEEPVSFLFFCAQDSFAGGGCRAIKRQLEDNSFGSVVDMWSTAPLLRVVVVVFLNVKGSPGYRLRGAGSPACELAQLFVISSGG